MTVGELRERMSNLEFASWQKFYEAEATRIEIEMKKAKGRRGR